MLKIVFKSHLVTSFSYVFTVPVVVSESFSPILDTLDGYNGRVAGMHFVPSARPDL